MTKLYYLRGALGDEALLQDHEQAISELLSCSYSSSDLEKLKGHAVYSFRLSQRARLLFSLREVEGKIYLVVLDYLPTHYYQKSRFLRAGVLSHYMEKHAGEHKRSVADKEFVFEALGEAHQTALAAVQRDADVGIAYKVLDYYQQHFIELNPNQQETIDVPLPAVVSGVAGSGKSCVSLSLLVSYLNAHQGEDEVLPLLYVSKSQALVQAMQAMWRALPLAQDYPDRLQFSTYNELLPVDAEVRLTEEEDFPRWYADYVKSQGRASRVRDKELVLIGASIAYQECRIASAYSKDEYISLGERQSSLSSTQRAWLYETYEQYGKFLMVHRQQDPAFYRWKGDRKYALVVVDEAQDLSHRQLIQLEELAEERSVVYCLDSHQRLFDSRSVRPFLLERFRIGDRSHVELNVTYRCPLKVVAAANMVIALKHRLAGGIGDKFEATHLTAAAQEKGQGHLSILKPEQLQEHLWLMGQIDQPYCAIVTSKAHIEEARALFKTPLVFTPEGIKGLEYLLIIAYKIYEPALFREAHKRHAEIKKEQLNPRHRPKAGTEDERFGPALNKIYTAYTRALQVLVLCEPQHHHYDLLIKPLEMLVDKESPSQDWLDLQDYSGDWDKQVGIQLDAGNDEVAHAIFTSKLGNTSEEFRSFVRDRKKDTPAPLPAVISVPVIVPAAAAPKPIRQPEAKPPTLPKKKVSKPKKPSSPPKAAAEPDPNETRQVLALAEDFTEKRLAVVLSVYGSPIWLTSYLKPDGQRLILADLLAQKSYRKILAACMANSQGVMQRIPFTDLLDRFLKNFEVHQYLIFVMAVKATFERQRPISEPALEPVHVAALANNCDQLLKLYKMGANLNQATSKGITAAHLAAGSGYEQLLSLLKDLGADLDKASPDGDTLTHRAVEKKQVKMLYLLKKLGVDLNKANTAGSTPALFAAHAGQVGLLRVLKELGADLDKANYDGATPALAATYQAHGEVLEVLKELGADLDKEDNVGATPAYLAAYQGRADLLRILKKSGADLNKANHDGATPAQIAAHKGSIECLRVLHELGADLDKANCKGATPAFVAALNGFRVLLHTLKELGADLNKANHNGATPAYIAVKNGYVDVLCTLKELEADLDKADNKGITPAYLAAYSGEVEMLQVLISARVDLRKKYNCPKGVFIEDSKSYSAEIQERTLLKIKQLDPSGIASSIELSPLDIAEAMGHKEAIMLLRQVLSISPTQTTGFFAPSFRDTRTSLAEVSGELKTLQC